MLFHPKPTAKKYDPAVEKPVLHRSICTGETTAGFQSLQTGKITEVMLIRSEKELRAFMADWGIAERPETVY